MESIFEIFYLFGSEKWTDGISFYCFGGRMQFNSLNSF